MDATLAKYATRSVAGTGIGSCVRTREEAVVLESTGTAVRVPDGASPRNEADEEEHVVTVDRAALERALIAYDHDTTQAMSEGAVGDLDVDVFLQKHGPLLVQMRLGTVDPTDLLRDCPPQMADEPIETLLRDGHGLTIRQQIVRAARVKLQLDAYVILLSLAASLFLLHRRYLLWPTWRAEYLNDPFFVAVDNTVMSVLLNASSVIIAVRLFGQRLMPFVASAFIPYVLLTAAVLATVYALNVSALSGPAMVALYFPVWLTLGWVAQRKTDEHVLRKLSWPQLVGIILYGVYAFILPVVWRSMTNDLQRAAFRLFVHPILFEASMALVRFHARTMSVGHPRALYLLVSYLQMISALYGRFLVSATASSATTIIIAVLLAVQESALRLSVGARDRLLYRLWYGRTMTADQVRARFHTPRALRLRGELICSDQIAENTGIIVSMVGMLLFGVNIGATRLSNERIVVDTVIQYAIEYGTDVIVMAVEISLGVPLIASWKSRENNRPGLHFVFAVLFAVLGVWIFSGTFFHPINGFGSTS